MSTNVIQALKDIEKAIKAQGGGSGGGGDDGDESESIYPILFVSLRSSGIGGSYFVSSDYDELWSASNVNNQFIVVIGTLAGQSDSKHYYQSGYGEEEFTAEDDGNSWIESVPYFEFRAVPDASGIDYVRVYASSDDYDYIEGFVEVKVGHYSSGPYVIECDITGSADAGYPTVYPCAYTSGHENDRLGIAEAISAGRDVVVLLHTNGNVSAGVESGDVYLPLESPTPTGMDEDAYWFQRVLSHRYGQDGTGVGNLAAVSVRLDGNGPYANIYQIGQS